MSLARISAYAAAALLGLVAALHVFWALGGTWAIHAVSGGQVAAPSMGLRALFAALAALAIVAAVEALILGRVASGPRLRRTALVMVAVLAVGGIIRLGVAPAVGITALALALFFAVLSGPHAE